MATRTCRVGIHGRNNVTFDEVDYQVIRAAKIEAIKMMGQTRPAVFKRLKQEHPNLELITRLYDDRFGLDTHPSPERFAEKQIPIIKTLRPYCVKFEVHNEPNHLHRYEGWGQEDHHAQDFNAWFLRVYELIKNACPWALLGFPGLAIPHRDLEWIEVCRPAVERADWLGVHCYWQTPAGQGKNHLTDFWGLRFKYYHQKFPAKIQEITECGNSNIQADPPIPTSDDVLAQQYAEYFQELFKYRYINSAAFFLLSSQDPTWDFFSWRSENGRVKPVVSAVGAMRRPTLITPQPIVQPFAAAAPGPALSIGGGGTLPALQARDISATLPQSGGYPSRPTSQIRQIIIHHTAVSEKIGPRRIAKVQVEQNHKPAIGYHYFVAGDGTVYQTNPVTAAAEHTQGHNQTSIAVAFAGNFTATVPTAAQLKAGSILCAWLMVQYNIPPDAIRGASELVATQSPGKQWLANRGWKTLLLNEINRVQGTVPITTAPVAAAAPTTGDAATLNAQITQLTAQLVQARAKNAAASATIAQLKAQLAQGGGQTATANGAAGEIAALKERIAMLELQLSVAQEAAAGPAPSPTPPVAAGPDVPPPPIEEIVDSLTRSTTMQYPTRSTTAITTLVIHHTAVPPTIDAARIAEFNVTKNGWPGIGFHYFITEAGVIQQTNRLTTISYHAGSENSTAVGLAFAGNFDDAPPTGAQIEAGAHLAAWLLARFNLPLSAVRGHKELASTPCPGKQWDAGQRWQNSLKQAIQTRLGGAAAPPAAPSAGGKAVYHYMLFWQTGNTWAEDDFAGAQNYIQKFQPSVGFSLEEAASAQFVTIVGGPRRIPPDAEARLRAGGCQVERIAANTPQATKALFDNLARTNRRFLTLKEPQS